MFLFHRKCWLTNLVPYLGVLSALALVSQGAAQELENRGTGDITISDISGKLSSSTSLQASGVSFSLTDFWPKLGLIETNMNEFDIASGFRAGLSYVKLSDIRVGNEKINFSGGAFTLDPFAAGLAFSSLTTPIVKLSGFDVQVRGKNHYFRVFGGRELLLEGLYVPLAWRSGQNAFGGDATYSLYENLNLTGRVIWFSVQDSKSAANFGLLTPLPGAFSSTVDFTWKANVHLQALTQFGYSQLQGGSDSRWRKTFTGGVLWDSSRLTAHGTYTQQPISYFPAAGYFATARKGYFTDLDFRVSRWLNTFGSVTVQNNTILDPFISQLSNTSSGAGASLILPAQSSVSVQYLKSQYYATTQDSPNFQRDHLTTVVASRAFRRHTAHFNASWLTTTSNVGLLGQNSWQLQDDLTIGQFTVTGASRFQQTINNGTSSGIYVSGGLRGNIKSFTFSGHFESGSDLASRTLFANATNSQSFTCQYKFKRDWSVSADIWRSTLITQLLSNPALSYALNGPLIPLSLANVQWTAYFRLNRQIGWGHGAYSSADIARYAEQATPRLGTIQGLVLATHLRGSPTVAPSVTVLLDGFRRAMSDPMGKYTFTNVGEGPHYVEIDERTLPVDYIVDKSLRQPALVLSSHATVVNFTMTATGSLDGTVESANPELLKALVATLIPTGQYTIVSPNGYFYFDGIPEGNYVVSLGAYGASEPLIITPESFQVTLVASAPVRITFKVAKKVIPIPVRKVQIASDNPARKK